MSVRRAQDERIEGTPDGLNQITEIMDVPDAPTVGTPSDVGTSRAYNNGAATVSITSAVTGGTPASYTVTSSPGSFTASGASPLTVTGLSSNTSYTFTATATNTTGTGAASASSSSVTATTVPQAPTVGTVTDQGSTRPYNNGQASVAFTPGATGGKTVSTYTVTSSPGSYTNTGASSPIVLTGLQSATAYTYTVTATNANGTSSASSASGAVTATTVPQAPTIGTATGAEASASVSFTANATGGSSITGYTVTSSPGGVTATGASSPITVSGLTNGTAYTFTVTATNANGTSAASSASNSVTPAIPSSYYSLATATATGSSSTITFSSISNAFKALQFKIVCGSVTANMTFNSDTASNYSYRVWSNSYGMYVTPTTSGTSITAVNTSAISNAQANYSEIIISDYASSSKKKSVIGYGTFNASGYGSNGYVYNGFWDSTAAITSVTFTGSANFPSGTIIALYGIK